MKLQKPQKVALATIGVLAIQSAVIWLSYSFGSNDGFIEGRSGYMKTPTTSGTIKINSKGEPEFKPFPSVPYFDRASSWYSKENQSYIEHQIGTNMGNTQFGQWVKTRVKDVKCTPTRTANSWSCSYRLLADSSKKTGIYNVNPTTGEWAGQSQ